VIFVSQGGKSLLSTAYWFLSLFYCRDEVHIYTETVCNYQHGFRRDRLGTGGMFFTYTYTCTHTNTHTHIYNTNFSSSKRAGSNKSSFFHYAVSLNKSYINTVQEKDSYFYPNLPHFSTRQTCTPCSYLLCTGSLSRSGVSFCWPDS